MSEAQMVWHEPNDDPPDARAALEWWLEKQLRPDGHGEQVHDIRSRLDAGGKLTPAEAAAVTKFFERMTIGANNLLDGTPDRIRHYRRTLRAYTLVTQWIHQQERS